MIRNRWNREQLKLAYYLYCQLPFGRLHNRNPEIIELAKLIGRTPSAVAMKLVNFASLDPIITGSGRKGLSAASELDRGSCGRIPAAPPPAGLWRCRWGRSEEFEIGNLRFQMRKKISSILLVKQNVS